MIKITFAHLPDVEKTITLDWLKERLHPSFLPADGYWPDHKPFANALGKWLCQQLISEYNLGKNILKTLHRNDYGKWKLNAPIDFNISHSGDYVVAATIDQGMIGIDIEKIRPILWIEYKDCFTLEELDELKSSDTKEKTFFTLWTKKESIAKAYGLGMQIEFNRIQIDGNVGKIAGTSMCGYFSHLNIPQYIGHVCTDLKDQTIQITSYVI